MQNSENGDLIADSSKILIRRKNCFSQLLNAHRVSEVRQMEIHPAEPLIQESNTFENKFTIPNMKSYISLNTDQFAA
jgi:hypothetical protein